MNKKIYTTLNNGQKIEYDVILTFKNETNQKDYIVYTDNQYDKENKLKIYASIYNPYTNQFLGTPETQDEWNQIYKVLDNALLNN